jgi:hypothetical protein
MDEYSHYRTLAVAFPGDWRPRRHDRCRCTLAVIPTYTMGEYPGELTLRSECGACERTRLWTRLSLRLGIPLAEAMDIAHDAPAHVLPGIFALLGGVMCDQQLRDMAAA